MKRIGAAGPVTLGLDVSHYQGMCDFQFLKSLNTEFVISKCTEITVDDTFASDQKSAANNGLIFGAYDYFHPSRNGSQQAEFFLNMSKPKKGDLRPMVDVETLDAIGKLNVVGELKRWLDTVEAATGAPPIIYGGPYFLEALALQPVFRRYPLAVAHYGTTKPLVPSPWTNWTFHQYTDKGNLRGIKTNEDLDRFNGTREQLLALCL